MSESAEDIACRGLPWEIYTSVRFDPLLKLADDKLQERSSGDNSPLYVGEFHRQRLRKAAEFFGWTACLDHECLQDLAAWDECVLALVTAYQEANAAQGITVDTPLFVRMAMINPKIISDYNAQTRNIEADESKEYQDYIRQIEGNPTALAAGLHFKIFATPETSLRHLFPSTFSPPLEQRQLQTLRFKVVLDNVPTDISPFTYIKTFPRTKYESARQRMSTILASITSTAREAGSSNGREVPSDNEILLFNHAGEITEGSISSVYFRRDGRWVTPPAGPDHGGLPGVGRRWALEHGLCIEQTMRREDVVEGEHVWLSNGVRGFVPGIIIWTKDP